MDRKPKRGLAIWSCILGILSIPTFGLVLVGALVAIALGVTALVKASRNPREYGGKTAAIVGILCAGLSLVAVPFLGIGAAIAIPSLLRAKVSANEAAASQDISAVIAAENAYARANGGYYDRIECLQQPDTCLLGRGALAPFLTGLPEDHLGYRHTFHAGTAATPDEILAYKVSPTSLRSYAVTSVPLQQGATGIRSFCGDSKGQYCLLAQGEQPAVAAGACVLAERGKSQGWLRCKAQGN